MAEQEQEAQQPPRPQQGAPRGKWRRRVLRFVGVGLYQLTVRLAVNLATVALFVYFAVNSAAVAGRISTLASEQVPGTITTRHIQWGPDPGQLRLIRPVVTDASGHLVLAADWISVKISWLSMLHRALKGDGLREIRVGEVVLAAPKVALEQDAEGRLRLAMAFVKPHANPSLNPPPTAPLALILDSVKVQNGLFRLDLNGTRIDAAGVQFSGEFRIALGGKTAGRYSYSGHGVKARQASIWLQAFETAGLPQLPGGAMRIGRVVGDEHVLRCAGIGMTSPETRIARGDVRVRLDAPGPTPGTTGMDIRVRDAALTTSTAEAFVGKLLGPTFAASGSLEGGLHMTSTGAMRVTGKVTGAGKMAGFQTRSVSADIAVNVGDDADEIVRVRAKNLIIEAFGGELRSEKLTYRLGKDGDQRTVGKVQLKGISVAEALMSEAVGMTAASVGAMAGDLDGEVETDVRLRIDKEQTPPLTVISKVGGTLTLRRGTAATLLPKALPTLYLRGQIDTVMTPHSAPARPLSVDLGQVLVSDQAAADGGPKRATNANWLFTDGTVDLHRQRVALRVDVNAPSIAELLLPFGIKGVDGAVRLDDIGVHGPWLKPDIAGAVEARRVLAGGHRIKRLTTRIKLHNGILALEDVRADVALGRARGDLTLDLYRRDLTDLRAHMILRGAHVGLAGVDLAGLLTPYQVRDIKGSLDLSKVTFEMDLADPIKSIKARAHVHISRPILRHERLKRLDTEVRFGGGRVELRKLELEYLPIALAALARRVQGPTVTVKRIAYELDSKRFEVDALHWPEMPLSRIGEVAALKMPLHGSIEMDIPHAKGSLTDIAFDATMRFRELAWGTIFMGDARVSLRKARGEAAVVASESFFKRFKLLDGSRIYFSRLAPTWMQFFMRTRRLDPMAFLGLPPMAGLRMLATGRAEFRLDFRPGHDIFSVHTVMPKGGAELELGNGLDPITNLFPATVDVLPDRVKIGSMSLPFGRDTLEMCGEFLYPNEAKKTPSLLRMYFAGTFDVPRFGALAESMAALDMRLRIGKDPQVDLDKRSRCLKTSAARAGILRIAGPLDALAAQGRLRLLKSRMTPRGYGKEIVLSEGAQLTLTTAANGQLRLQIPVDSRLEGRIEEGSFSTWGTMNLLGYAPLDMDWRFDGVDLAHTVPKEYSVVVSTQLRLLGVHLADEKRRNLMLSGKVKVTEGTYSKSFDRLGKVISGVRGRELDAYSQPLFERLPWMGRIGMNLKVNGSNFLVLSRFPFGKTDLELSMDLKVKGTFAQPRIYDRVVVEPGSILTYSVVKRDFEVTRGTVDFRGDPAKGVLDLEAKDDVNVPAGDATTADSTLSVGPNLAGSGTSGYAQTVTVIIRVSGPLDDPSKLAIEFRSVPTYQQGDIQSLILTGQLLTQRGASGSLGSRSSINLLTDDLAQAFSDMVLSAFVDKVSIGIPVSGGGITATVTTSLGKYLTLRGEYLSKTSGRVMTGRFAFMLPLEGLYLESLLISNITDNKITSNIFEGRVRYRLTLED